MKAAVLKIAERLFSAVGGYMKFLPKLVHRYQAILLRENRRLSVGLA
jgi:hypothetical protein